ncbi:MAG: hypothetical protein GTO02_13405, partial [Candidatus Dadabacteria bacterium]|nr:hypothetical protein [Candidatus Dadabacteria bacterium]
APFTTVSGIGIVSSSGQRINISSDYDPITGEEVHLKAKIQSPRSYFSTNTFGVVANPVGGSISELTGDLAEFIWENSGTTFSIGRTHYFVNHFWQVNTNVTLSTVFNDLSTEVDIYV